MQYSNYSYLSPYDDYPQMKRRVATEEQEVVEEDLGLLCSLLVIFSFLALLYLIWRLVQTIPTRTPQYLYPSTYFDRDASSTAVPPINIPTTYASAIKKPYPHDFYATTQDIASHIVKDRNSTNLDGSPISTDQQYMLKLLCCGTCSNYAEKLENNSWIIQCLSWSNKKFKLTYEADAQDWNVSTVKDDGNTSKNKK